MVISRHISGKFRNYRYIIEAILMSIYLFIPWVVIDGKPLMRLDIPARKFYFLGSIYIPQEGYFLHVFLLTMGLSLFFFTSLLGRMWCGWACPQTIFTDVYDIIGRLVLGKKYGKKDAPLVSKFLLYLLWAIMAVFFSFEIAAYFNDPRQMLNDLFSGTMKGNFYPSFIAFLAVALYLDMTLVREQFCRYACPYARFQTVLMDAHSYNVTYDYKRGEPRRNKKVKIGDCTACNMCLVVCPTGIDIREGANVGCIACAKCIDACTVQMGKEGKKTLIDYDSLARIDHNEKIKWIRPRTLIYGTILGIIGAIGLFLLYTRVPLHISAIPDRNIAPMVVPEKKVRNFYSVHLINMSYDDRQLKLSLDPGSLKVPMELLSGNENNILKLSKNNSIDLRLIVESGNLPDKEKVSSKIYKINLIVEDINDPSYKKIQVLTLVLPGDPELN